MSDIFLVDFQNAFLSYVKKSETKAGNSTSDNDNISESSVENPSSGGKSDTLQSGDPGGEEASVSGKSATPTVQTRASALKDESVSETYLCSDHPKSI